MVKIEDNLSNQLGQYLRQQRKAKRMTLEQTAQNAGIGRVTLNRWETGAHLPRLPELEQVLSALEITGRDRLRALKMLEAPCAQMYLQEEVRKIGNHDIGVMPHAGELLQAMRLRYGMSQEALAQAVGVTARSIRLWENGEVWPPNEKLHLACFTLRASPSEVVALTCGRFELPSNGEDISIDKILNRLKQVEQWATLSSSYSLCDLEYLQLEAQGWKLAKYQDIGKILLAKIYTSHARNLSLSFQDNNAGAYALRALNLLPKGATPPKDEFWHTAIILYAVSLAQSQRIGKTLEAYDMLDQWLPSVNNPLFSSWIHSIMGTLLLDIGDQKCALKQAEMACKIAEGCQSPMELRLRRLDLANILIGAGQGEKAMPLLDIYEKDKPIRKVALGISRARAYMAMKENNTANQELKEVIHLCQQYQLTAATQEAEEIVQSL